MAMKLIKKVAEYKIFMRGDDRYAVQDANGRPVNGEEKVRILMEENLIKVTSPSLKEEAPPTDDAADSGDGATEVATEADAAAGEPGSEAEASDDAGEPEPDAEEKPEGAAPEAEPEPEAGAEAAEDEGEAESEEKDK